ncbi:Xaa-Pro peptidase family protein [Paralimibaculum aggregatum]|uniref:Xaa-Pro peptidase family protein n=1 Tax=Paralimibaculum aggregatum TaxID=3036245 RepID=A0ABQ6LJB8_9RHOB|nr:dimethylsulfonioproprionate lyase DddP [Limibaculum sp. NKW23]GMG82269.1 Xaa-Pro peptidase family protein [Limibaculum sp. NKW23]
MNEQSPFSPETRKIDPARRPALPPGRKGDNTPDDPDRAEIGPTRLAYDEWAAAGLELPDLPAMRAHRHARLTAALAERDWGGVLFFDPLNIRYATDSTNMQLWNAHNPFRALLVCADGHMVLWEYKGAAFAFLSDFNPAVKEVRGGASMFYFATGDRGHDVARGFAGEVAALMQAHAPGNRRLGVDKIQVAGFQALEAAGFAVMEGEELSEKTRAIKGPDEIRAMRCAMHACEASVAAMEAACRPGLSEDEVWAVLHSENIRRGGEWIETRLLASGPRTSPWFQECGPRVIRPNEIVAFDTDLIGCYGMCADISRTWWVGEDDPTPEMRRQFRIAHEHIMTNMEMLKPGVPFRDIVFGGHALPEEFVPGRYGVKMHGVGLCDEWPSIKYPQDFQEGAFDYALEPGMMLCVEALVQSTPGDFAIKLEDQVLITETGYENLTRYPFDARLLG